LKEKSFTVYILNGQWLHNAHVGYLQCN